MGQGQNRHPGRGEQSEAKKVYPHPSHAGQAVNHKGKIAPSGRIGNQTAKWKELSGVSWKSDALRHSYASYKLALCPDVAALSFEMGNSPTMIKRHYLDLKHEDEARKWFKEEEVKKSSKRVKRGRSQMASLPV